MQRIRKDQLLGKLDLLVLRILSCGESMHGYAIAERIELLSGNVFQVGIRSPVYDAADVPNNAAIVHRTYTTEDVDAQGYRPIADQILSEIGNQPVYVSVDIDVLDPAFAPGTGTPEPGGLTSRELVHFLRELHRVNVVGFDVVEVAPQYDHMGQVTALAAANAFFEAMSAVAKRRRGAAPQ